ncbi:MAG: sterol 24-C-methyltransferase family protein [Bryobacterales bacterium]|nr:sterol 24-C-methyltransferase family protein [Bryobacterales bacterium]
MKLSDVLKDAEKASGVDSAVSEYEEQFKSAERGEPDVETSQHTTVNNLYYDLITDFFEYGWGRSFHFAPRVPGESFKASLARHEHYMAHALGLRPGMVVADIGCGVGGPLMEIARFSGAKIVGVNSNGYQLERARKLTREAKLTDLADFLHCDFLSVEAPDESFDAVYSIEASCCAPDKVSVYSEIYRLLKPGACFGAYEYCMTDRFDPTNPRHVRLKADIQLGGGLLIIDDHQTVDDALRTVGFEVLETRDLTLQTGPSIPWYQPLAGSGISFASFRSSRIGRSVTHGTLKVLEALRVVPQGSVRVADTLNLCATAMVEAGRLGIFTPMYFVHARKPA